MPVLNGVNASPFVRKVRVVLAHKGIDYKLEPVMPMNVSAEYKKKSPLGKVPCFEDGDFVLPDSSCIIAYLERVHPKPPVYPSDPKQYARALWYEEYADTKLAETVGPLFFERIVKGKVLKAQPDEERVRKTLAEAVPPVFDYLEGELRDGDTIVGDALSVADIAIGSQFVNFAHGGGSIDAKRWPKLARYVGKIHRHPAFQPLIAEETAQLAGL